MADYDAADLLSKVKLLARRPISDLAFADDSWFALMTMVDEEVKSRLAALAPDAMYGPPTLLVTTDGGATYKFPNDPDNGMPYFPLGHCEIYASKRNIPDEPLEPMVDFLIEGSTLRIPGDKKRAFADGAPWARFVQVSGRIDGSNEPTLQPKTARMVLVYGAIALYAERPGSGINPETWNKRKEAEFQTLLRVYRTQYNMQAAIGDTTSYARSLSLLGGGN